MTINQDISYYENLNLAQKLASKVTKNGNIMNSIGGEFVEGKSSQHVKFPFDGKSVFEYSIGSVKDVKTAIDLAEKSIDNMKALTLYNRSLIIDKVVKLLESYKEEIASIIVFETGKTFKDSAGEVERAISTMKFTSESVKEIKGETLPLDTIDGSEKRIAFTKLEPVGVVGAITGFNFPLLLAVHKIAPALGAANTVVLKPSPNTPVSSLVLAYLFKEAGLPNGSLSVVSGDVEVGKELVSNPLVKAISFTGSSEVGKQISKESEYKKVLLELGSNAATIVDSEKNLKEVAEKLVKGGMSSNGQSCISVQRVIVNKNISEELIRLLEENLKNIKVGNPFDKEVQISSLFTPESNSRILSWVDEAKNGGAKIIVGGNLQDNILKPTLITNVKSDMKVFCEEIFGPVVVVSTFTDFEEAVNMVNESRYGLQVGIFTDLLGNALTAIEKIDSGSVHINEISNFRPDHMPYGGTKDSGIGKEGPKYVIDELTNKKVVSLKQLE